MCSSSVLHIKESDYIGNLTLFWESLGSGAVHTQYEKELTAVSFGTNQSITECNQSDEKTGKYGPSKQA